MDAVIPAMLFVAAISSGNALSLEVEKAYWDCEYAALQGAVDLDDAAACNDNFERLKKHRFHGSFQHFHAWWQKNKNREMSARERTRLPRRER
jgi:hypothetical protein